MNNEGKTKTELLDEIKTLRGRIIEVEKTETDRRRAEDEMKKNAALLSETQNFANLGSWEWDPNTNDMFWSDEMFRIYGFKPGEIKGDFDRCLKMIHPADFAKVDKFFNKDLPGKSEVSTEYRIIRKDGAFRYILAKGKSQLDKKKRPIRMSGIIQDITERKEVEEALRESEEKWRSLTEYSTDNIFTIDMDYNIIFINQVVPGLTKEETIGKSIYFFIPEKFHESVKQCFKRILKTKQPDKYYHDLTGPDGITYYFEARVAPMLKDGKITGFTISTTDITNRKHAEEKIEHLNTVLRAIRNVNQLITKEKDPDKLIASSCKLLIENRGYFNSWISIYNNEGKFRNVASSGIGKEFSSLKKMLKDGKMVKCQIMALKKDGVITIDDASKMCKGCPQASKHKGTGILVTRLKHEKKTFGTITVSLPKELVIDSQEQSLFKDLADDVSFALYSISIEEERKRAEKALRASETRYRRLFETAKDGILLLDADTGQIIEVNPFLITMLGYTHQELLGKHLWEIGLFKDISASKVAFKELQKREYIRYEDLPLETKEEKRIEVEFVSNVYQVDGRKVIQCNIRDITKRQRAKQALRESEEKYRKLIETMSDGLAMQDTNGILTYANTRLCNMLGYTRDEIVGKSWKSLFDEEGLKILQEQMAKRKAGEQSTYDIPWKTKDGREIYTLIAKSPIHDAEGNLAGNIGVITDITEHKRAEEERKRLNANLVEKNKELEQIVYATSHDLRSPLINVQGFSKELDASLNKLTFIIKDEKVPIEVREKVMAILNDDISESLQYILTSVSKMDSLLNGLLKLSRLDRTEFKKEKLNMNRIISDVVKTFEFQIKEADVNLEIAELPPCKGDVTQINQVFLNLIDNALKYLNPKRPGNIKISGDTKKDQVVYCVADNGIGIAPENLDKVFDIFHQLNPEISTGEGLGLTIIRKILDKNNGKVWVKSKLDEGSKFFISLPIV